MKMRDIKNGNLKQILYKWMCEYCKKKIFTTYEHYIFFN